MYKDGNKQLDNDRTFMIKELATLLLAIAIIASFAMVSASIPIRTGWNGEDVNATVFGTFVVTADSNTPFYEGGYHQSRACWVTGREISSRE